jgi:hypothetical protein
MSTQHHGVYVTCSHPTPAQIADEELRRILGLGPGKACFYSLPGGGAKKNLGLTLVRSDAVQSTGKIVVLAGHTGCELGTAVSNLLDNAFRLHELDPELTVFAFWSFKIGPNDWRPELKIDPKICTGSIAYTQLMKAMLKAHGGSMTNQQFWADWMWLSMGQEEEVETAVDKGEIKFDGYDYWLTD